MENYGLCNLRFEDDKMTLGLVLGDGSTIIAGVSMDSATGIGFSINDDPKKKVGHFTTEEPIPVDEIDFSFFLISDNPESFQIIIDKLIEARNVLIEKEK